MRTFNLKFSWNMLCTWISLIEQWPYRMCWIIEYCCPDETLNKIPFIKFDNNLKISEVYLRIKNNIVSDCALATEIDGNLNEFELILFNKRRFNVFLTDNDNIENSAKQHQNQKQLKQKLYNEEITVEHVRVFASCTSNLDPYMRKYVREMYIEFYKLNNNLINIKDDDDIDIDISGLSLKEYILKILGNASVYLFGEDSCEVWSSKIFILLYDFFLNFFLDIKKPLIKMSIDEIIQLISKLNISSKNNLDILIRTFISNNLNGLVLQTCDLLELKNTLKVVFIVFVLIICLFVF